MKLVIENIGAITSASVDIGNLTVIAGENDVGKSTIGRVFFAIVHAYGYYPAHVKKNQLDLIRVNGEQINQMIRRTVDMAKYPKLRFKATWAMADSSEAQIQELRRLRKELEEFDDVEGEHKPVFGQVDQMLAKIVEDILAPVSPEKAIGELIFKTLQSEFSGQIVRRGAVGPSKIKLIDGATTILDMAFNESEVISFSGGDSLGINDTSLVEGAAIFQLSSALRGIELFDEKNYTRRSMPMHAIDLLNKLQNSTWHGAEGDSSAPTSTQSLHGSVMSFDHDTQEFYLHHRGERFLAHNAASGIKALVILDLLTEGAFVRDDTLLILDEPETNLHPKWQIEYAKIICKLASEGKKFLVTTHSPYMLEALKGYSSKVAESRFYLAHRDEDQVIRFTDTLGDITPIIDTLSRPLADMLDELGHDF